MKAIKGVIKPSEMAEFTKHKDGINVFMILFLYGLSGGLVYLSHKSEHWSVYLISFLIMGAIQHTIATFIHEAAHGHLFSNKKLNDKLGQLFFAAPIFSFLEDYRLFHMDHHRFNGKADKDPEAGLYAAIGLKDSYSSKTEVLKVFLQDFTGVNFVKSVGYLLKYSADKKKSGELSGPGIFENLTILLWTVVLPLVMWKVGMLSAFLIVWMLPLFTLSQALLRWHGYGEHVRGNDGDLAQNTLTHRFGLISTLYLYPLNSSFHLEHHLYPQLPWYSLRTFRKWADETNPEYCQLASKLEVDGYFFGKKSVIKTSLLNA